MKQRVLSGLFGAALALAVAVPVFAAKVITIQVEPDVKVYVNDAPIDAGDTHGNPEAFIYNGTTYIAAKAVSLSLGEDVQWDGDTRSVYIGEHMENNWYESEDLVTDAYSSECIGGRWIYSYEIPKITLPGEDVARINEEIYDVLYPIAKASEEEIKEFGFPVTSEEIWYYGHINGNILSLVIENDSYPETSGGTEYIVYNVDLSTGEQLSNAELLQIVGLSEEEYHVIVRQVLKNNFWDGWNLSDEVFDEPSFAEFFYEQQDRTLSDENIAETYIYIEYGELRTVAKQYSLAAGDYYWHALDLGFEWEPGGKAVPKKEVDYIDANGKAPAEAAWDYFEAYISDNPNLDSSEFLFISKVNRGWCWGPDGNRYHEFMLARDTVTPVHEVYVRAESDEDPAPAISVEEARQIAAEYFKEEYPEGVTQDESSAYDYWYYNNAGRNRYYRISIFDKETDYWIDRIFVNAETGECVPGEIGPEDTTESVDLRNLVTDAYYSECDDGDWSYTYRIPQINLSVGSIEQINGEIYNTLYPIIDYSESAYEDPDASAKVVYSWAVNGNILSLVVVNEYYGHDYRDYYVYNIDISTGEKLSDAELLQAVGLSEEDYRETVGQRIKEDFSNEFGPSSEWFAGEYFYDLLEENLSEENIAQSKPYINGDGQLCAVARVCVPAGGGEYWGEFVL